MTTEKRDTMKDKDYTRSNKMNLYVDSIFHELRDKISFTSDPLLSKLCPELLQWI